MTDLVGNVSHVNTLTEMERPFLCMLLLLPLQDGLIKLVFFQQIIQLRNVPFIALAL